VGLVADEYIDEDGLYILGHYHVQPHGLGRYVSIYYGSLIRAYGWMPPEQFKGQIKSTLHHELTHHLESLAGDKSLEVQDAIDRAKYKRILD